MLYHLLFSTYGFSLFCFIIFLIVFYFINSLFKRKTCIEVNKNEY